MYEDGTYLRSTKPKDETYVLQDFDLYTGDTNEVTLYPDDNKHGGDMRPSISGAHHGCSSMRYTFVRKPSDS